MKKNKLKIVNMKKFIRSILIVFSFIILLSLFITKSTWSHKEIKYKSFSISYGDTLWSIALNEQRYNLFYKNTDVRDIVDNIVKVNNLNTSSIYTNQKILIPTY